MQSLSRVCSGFLTWGEAQLVGAPAPLTEAASVHDECQAVPVETLPYELPTTVVETIAVVESVATDLLPAEMPATVVEATAVADSVMFGQLATRLQQFSVMQSVPEALPDIPTCAL